MRGIVMITAVGVLGAGLVLATQRHGAARAEGLLPYTDPAAVAAGEDIYLGYCASCHMDDLSGEAEWRRPKPSGRMPAPPHDETGHTWHHADVQLFMLTKYGTAALVGNGYESDMIGFEGTLSDEQILQVLAYIKSTWPEEIIERHNGLNADQ